jgi:methyltransferase (TIGR00027 family)
MAREAGPADTAFGPMVIVAIEQQEPVQRRLVDDDLALTFLPAWMRVCVRALRWPALRRLMIASVDRAGPGLYANFACRKRFVDERLDEALGSVDAVVILGAGMDTLGCRVARRSAIPVFEVDLPVNIDRKAKVVRRALGGPPPSVRLVPVDFERDDLSEALGGVGYQGSWRTFFVWEAVTQYLSESGVEATFAFLASAAPSSRLVFTYVQRDFIDGENMHGAESLYRRYRLHSQLWRFGMRPSEVSGFLARYGWRLISQAGPDYYVQHYIHPTGRKLAASEIEWSVFAEKL